VGLGLLLLGGLVVAALCGGGGLGGLLWFRPDLLADIPGLAAWTSPAPDPGPTPIPGERWRTGVESLVTQGLTRCDIRSSTHLNVLLTPEGRIQVEGLSGIPIPRKAQCLRDHLASLALQPGPGEPLRFSFDTVGTTAPGP
jgi:hypothetical protein